MRIDPLPQLFACGESLNAGVALDTHEIGRKPMAIAVGSKNDANLCGCPDLITQDWR
jgi:hypothetical protein